MDNMSNTDSVENAGGLKSESEAKSLEQAENASTGANAVSYGKFSGAEELLKAYNNLEVQFTKRSQELKRLERENNSLREEQAALRGRSSDSEVRAESHAIQDETVSVAKERTEKSASMRDITGDDVAEEVAKFLKTHPDACDYAEEIAQKTTESDDIGEGFLEKAYIAVLKDKLSAEREKYSDDYIYEKAAFSPEIREKLIRDYLSEVSAGKPIKLMSDSGSSVVMPPKKPQNIDDAGKMAVKVLRKK